MRATLLKGHTRAIVDENVKTLKRSGMSHAQAVHLALKHRHASAKKQRAEPSDESEDSD